MNIFQRILGKRPIEEPHPDYYIEKFDGADGPHFRLMHRNGQKLATSDAYSSHAKCDQTVRGIARAANFEVRR